MNNNRYGNWGGSELDNSISSGYRNKKFDDEDDDDDDDGKHDDANSESSDVDSDDLDAYGHPNGRKNSRLKGDESDEDEEEAKKSDSDDDDDADKKSKKKKKKADREKEESSKAASRKQRHDQSYLPFGEDDERVVMENFKHLSCKYRQGSKTKIIHYFFSHIYNPKHTYECRATLRLPYIGKTTHALSYLFNENSVSESIFHKTMLNVMEKNASDKNSFGCKRSDKIQLRSMEISDVVSTRPAHPIAINIIGGGVKQYTTPHKVSWDDATAYLTVATPGTQRQSIFSMSNDSQQDLASIEGVTDWEEDEKVGAACFGEVRNGTVMMMDMRLPHFPKFMNFLVYLVEFYIEHRKEELRKSAGLTKEITKAETLPDGITVSTWKKMCEFEEKMGTQKLYGNGSGIKRDYMGKLMRIINPGAWDASAAAPSGNLWAVSEDQDLYRIPMDFAKFVFTKGADVRRRLPMVRTKDLGITTHAYRDQNDAEFAPGDVMTLTVHAGISMPSMYYYIQTLDEGKKGKKKK